MKQRIVALLLALTLVVGLVGFANAETSVVDWMTPFAEPVTLTVARRALSLSLPDGEDEVDNIWTRTYKEKFNVDVVTEWISDDYDTKLNLAIASGSLPDVFVVNYVQLNQLMEAGLIYDLTESYDLYASATMKGIIEADTAVLETAKQDGRLYAIPNLYNGLSPELLWLRQDWMNTLGKEPPKNVAELEEILLAMKELSGGYSLAVDQQLGSLYNMANAWGAYPNIWVRAEDGSIIYGATAPEMKAALATWVDWYNKGILKADFATMNSDAIKEDIVSGKVGAITYQSWWGWIFGMDMLKNLGNEAYFMPYEMRTVAGEAARYPLRFPNDSYTVVNKNCKNIEAVIKLLNFYVYVNNEALALGEMTQQEIEAYNANNIAHVTPMFAVKNPLDDYNRYKMIATARDTGDRSVLLTAVAVECYDGSMMWLNDKDPAGIGYALQFGYKGCGMEQVNNIIDNDLLCRSAIWGASPEVLSAYGSTLDDILLEGFTKIIMGVEPIDYFDKLIEQWEIAGGAEVTEAVNLQYK